MSDIITQEMVDSIKAQKVEKMSQEEIRDVISVMNIQEGEKVKEEFKEAYKFGIKVQKKGRISYNVVEEVAPTLVEDIANIEGNPADLIESGVYDSIKRNSLDVNNMKKEEAETYKTLVNEIIELEKRGLIFNKNTIWDIWKIKRGERQKSFIEQEGFDVDFLIELYSYFSNDQIKDIKEVYKNSFDNEK